jgi:hypothetical protein
MFYCGPLVRLIFRAIFREKKTEAKKDSKIELMTSEEEELKEA